MAKKKVVRKRSPKRRTATPSSGSAARRITTTRRQSIVELAGLLAAIAPATSRGPSSFCVKNLAERRGHKKLWRDLANKRKSIAHYLEIVFRKFPRMPKKLVLEIVQGGVKWSAKRGVAVKREQLDEIGRVLADLEIDAKRELSKMELPDPSKVAPPPFDLQGVIERLELHPALKDDCIAMFKAGHLNEAIRKALERFEKKIQDLTGEHTIGKELMGKAFNRQNPLIAIISGSAANDASEQEGFMHLTMGAMAGMRNLYSHGDVDTITPMCAFERLAFVSLLFKRVDQAVGNATAMKSQSEDRNGQETGNRR
jgi:uncharacterized protein (TIGR02391 family)